MRCLRHHNTPLRRALPTTIVATSVVFGAAVPTAFASDYTDAQQAAQGDASVADPHSNTGITINPATISLIDRYDVLAQYKGGPGYSHRWYGSVVDGRTSKWLSFAFQYDGGLIEPEFHPTELPGWGTVGEDIRNRQQFHDFTIAMAVPISERRFSFGINGTLTYFQGDYIGNGVTGNMDIGFATRPVEFITASIVGKNILPVPRQASLPAAIAVGARGGKDYLFTGSAEFEYRFEDVQKSPWAIRAGVEGTIKIVQLRAGWDYDGDRDNHRISWGLGFFAKGVGSIDYAMQTPIVTEGFGAWMMTHTVSLTIRTKFGDRQSEEEPIRWEDGT